MMSPYQCTEEHPRPWGAGRGLHTVCLLLLLVLEPCPGGYNAHACVVSLSQLVSLQVAVENWKYVMAYVTCAGLISFAVLYRMSPPSDQRSLNLIQWTIQLVGVACIYLACPLQEVGVVFVIAVLILYNISSWSVVCVLGGGVGGGGVCVRLRRKLHRMLPSISSVVTPLYLISRLAWYLLTPFCCLLSPLYCLLTPFIYVLSPLWHLLSLPLAWFKPVHRHRFLTQEVRPLL